ncbi:MAG: glycosyltransferase family 2 protein [Pseudomonadota bacterium]
MAEIAENINDPENTTLRQANAVPQRDVSAVVVSYHTGAILAEALTALRGQKALCEIILVDNGNPDGAVDDAIRKSEVAKNANDYLVPLRVMSGHGNIGFAAACNLGVTETRGNYLFFCNPDAVPPRHAVAHLRARSDLLQRPFLIAPKLVDKDGGEQQGSRRAYLTPWRAIVEALFLYRIMPSIDRFNRHKDPCPEELSLEDVISGACFFLPKDDYLKIKGMDEDYFLHVEDVDFCVRLAKAGGDVWFDPTLSVVHHQGSSKVTLKEIETHKARSLELYFRKHFDDRITPGGFALLSAGLKAASLGRQVLGGLR